MLYLLQVEHWQRLAVHCVAFIVAPPPAPLIFRRTGDPDGGDSTAMIYDRPLGFFW